MRFTDEQLSRILGEHDTGRLIRNGFYAWGQDWDQDDPVACALQVARNICAVPKIQAGFTFDAGYSDSMTAEELLALCARM